MENKNNSKHSLIVNYVPQAMGDKEFFKMFREIGPLKSCRLMYDKATGYSFGYGFVEYCMEEDAMRAITKYNGHFIEGKVLKVAYSRPRSEQTRGTNIYVRYLPRSYDDESLKKVFEVFGEVVQARVIKDIHTGIPRGIAFVIMAMKSEAEKAVNELDGTKLDDSDVPLLVKFADEDGKRKQVPLKYMQQQSQMIGHIKKLMTPLLGHTLLTSSTDVTETSMTSTTCTPTAFRKVHTASNTSKFEPYQRLTNTPKALKQTANLTLIVDKMINSIDPITGGYIIYVYGVGRSPDENQIRSLFQQYGEVSRIDIIKNLGTNDCKGYCFVVMTEFEAAQNAIQALDKKELNGRRLQVRFKC